MRTFSSLKNECAHPELLKLTAPKNYARDKAADKGTLFHSFVEKAVNGQTFFGKFDEDVNRWAKKLFDQWGPPRGCMSEVAIGLDANGQAHMVDEPEPHVYVAQNGSELVTAGRLDLRWYEDEDTTLVVVDLKTGQSYLGDPWEIPQLVAQAVAATKLHNRINGRTIARVKLGVYYARLGIFDYGSGPRDLNTVENLWDSVYHWATMSNEPRPGGWCLSCFEKKQCAAFEEMTAA
jgi:hypothetical protein